MQASFVPTHSPSWIVRLHAVVLFLTAFFWLSAAGQAQAAILYWDGNGTISGAGTAPTGLWGTSAFWSTNVNGTLATLNTPTTALDSLIFSAGTTATGSYTITLNGTQNAKMLIIEDGTVTFSGGTLALGAGGGIVVATTAGNGPITSNLTITGAQSFDINVSHTLPLTTGTFTRNTGAVLNVKGLGRVTSTMTGLAVNNAATGIIGPWATVGTGQATLYATFSGSTITYYTSTAQAATAAGLTDTTGLVNYELISAAGTMPATVSLNTLYYPGAAATVVLGSSFTVNGLLHTGTGALTLSGNTLTIGADRELVVHTANANIILSSAIADHAGGASGLTKAGFYSLLLDGASTYTGTTTISQGVLFLGTGGTTGTLSPASAIVTHGTLQFNRSNLLTQGVDFGVISGTGTVTQSGTGTTALTANNTYAGTTTISQGVLSLGNGGTTGTLSPGSGITNNSTLQFNRSNTLTQGVDFGLISGTGAVTQSGAGTTALTASNTYTGTTTISQGVLSLGNGGATGAILTSTAIINNGTLQFNRNNSLNQGPDFGVISGTGTVAQSGTGTTWLSASNTYTGPTDISGGKLLVIALTDGGVAGPLGAASNDASNLVLRSGGTLLYNGTNAGTDRGFSLMSGTGVIEVAIAATNLTLAGLGSGPGTLIKSGPGMLTLTASNDYAGVNITAGILSVATIGNAGVSSNLGGGTVSSLELSGGTLRYTGTTASTDRGFTLTGSGGSIEVTGGGTALTFTGPSSGAGSLTKTGPGTLTLAGSNAHTGATTLSGGTLVLDYSASDTSKLSNSAPLVLLGGTLQLDRASAATGSHAEQVGSTTLSGPATLARSSGSSATLQMNVLTRTAGVGATLNFSAAGIATTDTSNTNGILGPWATLNGTDWAVSVDAAAADTPIIAYTAYTDVARLGGAHLIADGSTSHVRLIEGSGAAASLTLGAATTGINTLNQSASGSSTVDFTTGQTLRVGGILAASGSGALTLGSAPDNGTLSAATAGGELIVQNFSSNVLTLNAVIANNTTASSLTHAGSGTTVLAGVNTYTGKTFISGGRLSISTESALGASPATSTADQLTLNGGTLLSTASFTIDDTNRGLMIGLLGGTFEVAGGTTLTVAQPLSGTSGGLTKTGAGTLTLSATNTYTGRILVNEGRLSINDETRLGSDPSSYTADQLTLDGGTLVSTSGFTLNDPNRGITLGPAGGTFETTNSSTFEIYDFITGTGSLTKTGSGTLQLTALNTYAGATTVAGGTLRLGTSTTDGGIGSTLINVISGTMNFNNYYARSYSGTLNVAGSVAKSNSGSLELSGTFARSPGGTLNVQGTGVLTSTMTGLSANNAAGIIGPWATVGTGATTTYATFSGSSIISYTGSTTAVAPSALTDTSGLVNYNLGQVTGTLPATVSANTVRNTGNSVGTTTLGASFMVNGLMHAPSTNANWTLAGGTLTIGADRELVVHITGLSGIIISSVIADNPAGASALAKTGSNFLYLTGANGYTGTTAISGGTLSLGNGGTTGSLSPSSVIVNNGTLQFSRTNTLTQGADFGVISGTGAVTKINSGTTVLNASNTYTGSTTITAGILSVTSITDGGVAGPLGASSSAAANLIIGAGTLRYTGTTASTDRGFSLSNAASTLEVTSSSANLTFTGPDASSGVLNKTGPGTLTLAGSSTRSGGTTLRAGTLVLDYTATDTTKLFNNAALTLIGGTLQLDRASAATGTHVEVVGSTTLGGAATITRGSGSTAVLQMNTLTRTAGTGTSVNFGASGIANTDNTNTNGILGAWATINGADWALNSTNAADGLITAYAAYINVARLDGTHVIADGSAAHVRLIEGSGTAGNFTLGAATTTIATLNQSTSGGGSSATVDLAGQTLRVGGILAASGSGALTLGTAVNDGTLSPATAGGELIVQNFSSNALTINSVISNNTTASSLTHTGTGTTLLAGLNTYTGKTFISGGRLSISAESALGANPATGTADQLTLNGGTLATTATFSIANSNRGLSLGAAGGTLETSGGTTLTIANVISGTATGNSLTKTGTGTLALAAGSTYTGDTFVREGVLNVTNISGSATGSSALTLSLDATLAGTGNIAAGSNAITINGALQVGSSTLGTPVRSTLTLQTSGGPGITVGSTGTLRFDLFSGAGSGNNTASITASDLLILYGDISLLAGATLILENPNNMAAWAIGDQWRLWDVSNAGTRTGNFALANILGPALGGMVWTFDSSTGILSIVPEPGRASLLFLGLAAALFRRRRC